MASAEQHRDTLDQPEEEKLKHNKVQLSTGVSVDLNARSGATVSAPVLTGNTIAGPVTFINNTAGNEPQKISETEMEEKHTEKQDLILKKFLETHKPIMKKKAESIFEGKEEARLQAVYTELFITEGDMKDVNREHGNLKIDYVFNKNKQTQDKPIKCNDIFKLLRENKSSKRIVLTKGVSGIGKTVSVHKFILDWAEGEANQDIHCLYEKCKLAFIFDGLDESHLPLNFTSEPLNNVEESSSVDVLLTNLIRGNLPSSALVWVTSRPAAANQIPPECVGLFTEVRGFNDQQKEEYFRKRITDKSLANRIISHIKTNRSLYIMCHIPVFCWITATVLQHILIKNREENISTTLTEMYIHFLLIQMNMKSQKYDGKAKRQRTKLLGSNREMILKLAKLAFEQLKKGNFVFDEEDLEACDIDVTDTEYIGMITEFFKKEHGLHETKVFCFVHLSVQEFLAAVHVFLCYLNKNMQELQFFFDKPKENISLQELLKKAVDKAITSQRGHLDMFLRFLMGITLESSQNLLKGLIPHTEDTTESIRQTTKHIKRLKNKNISDEASVNLFYCLLELNDHSLYEEIQRYLSSDAHPGRSLSSSMCTVLIYILLMSEKVLEEFNPKRFTSSQQNYKRLIPAMRCCRKALFDNCGFDETCCETVSSALQSSNCHLTELDLSSNQLQDSGVKLLYNGLKSSHCQLSILRLCGCNLTAQSCESLSSALQSSNSHLRELDLSNNDLKDSGVKLLSDGLKSPNCQLEILKFSICNLTDLICESLSSVLQSSNSVLRELDLSNNDLKDSGVKLLSDGLKTNCKLEILRLSGCMVTHEGCGYLSSALSSNPSHLRELDLSYNHPGDFDARQLLEKLKNLDELNVDHGGESRIKEGLHKYSHRLTLDPNTVNKHLHLSENNSVTHFASNQRCPDDPDRFDEVYQVLCRESVCGRCYWELQWSGDNSKYNYVSISVSHKSISRKGWCKECVFGCNDKSWSLICSPDRYTFMHNNVQTVLPVKPVSCRTGVCVDPSRSLRDYYVRKFPYSDIGRTVESDEDDSRIGVFVDHGAGTLSFYSVSRNTVSLIHTVQTTFTQPLYPGFFVSVDSSVKLCNT